jgi:hypothetical protein
MRSGVQRRRAYFVDGAVSANNNPGLQLFMLALEPSYKFGWKVGRRQSDDDVVRHRRAAAER